MPFMVPNLDFFGTHELFYQGSGIIAADILVIGIFGKFVERSEEFKLRHIIMFASLGWYVYVFVF
jgi:hypothetical protein